MAESVRDLQQAAVDSRVEDRCVLIRDVLVSVFRADRPIAKKTLRAFLRAVEFQSSADLKGEVERAGVIDWDGLRRQDVSAQQCDHWLQTLTWQQIDLEACGTQALAECPFSSACPSVRDGNRVPSSVYTARRRE